MTGYDNIPATLQATFVPIAGNIKYWLAEEETTPMFLEMMINFAKTHIPGQTMTFTDANQNTVFVSLSWEEFVLNGADLAF
jgi:hypothetical protein